MTHLPLSCPQCEKPLVYIPSDGLALHYRCIAHGAIILRPLIVVEPEDDSQTEQPQHQLANYDAA
jgi:hypothetical protein